MRITAECSIDIDQQRKVWVTASGEVDPNDENVGEHLQGIAMAAAQGANKAHDHAIARLYGERTEDDPPRPPAQVE